MHKLSNAADHAAGCTHTLLPHTEQMHHPKTITSACVTVYNAIAGK